MDNKVYELELQMANIASSLNNTTAIQEKIIEKLDKVYDEFTMVKGWGFSIMGIFVVLTTLFDFKHFFHI